MGKIKKKFRQIKKLPSWIYTPPAVLLRTWKWISPTKVDDPHNVLDVEKLPYIGLTWHNRLLFLPVIFPKEIRIRTLAVVSASRDGQYLNDFLAQFGIGSIRGSSSRRGDAVLREGMAVLEKKLSVCMTPDGPRGPKYVMSKGPIALASKTRIPIVPFMINFDRYWELKSWDNFQIPKPGTRITLALGKPMRVPENLDEDALETQRKEVEKALQELLPDKETSQSN